MHNCKKTKRQPISTRARLWSSCHSERLAIGGHGSLKVGVIHTETVTWEVRTRPNPGPRATYTAPSRWVGRPRALHALGPPNQSFGPQRRTRLGRGPSRAPLPAQPWLAPCPPPPIHSTALRCGAQKPKAAPASTCVFAGSERPQKGNECSVYSPHVRRARVKGR